MARITVEDCLKHNNNRFDLILTASARARQLAFGAEAALKWEHDKPTVMALREIAHDMVEPNGNLKVSQESETNSQSPDMDASE